MCTPDHLPPVPHTCLWEPSIWPLFLWAPIYIPIHSAPWLPWHWLSAVFLITVILTGLTWYHIVVLIYVSLMFSDCVEHLFRYLLAIPISASEHYLLISFAHFFIDLLIFSLLLSCVTSFYMHSTWATCQICGWWICCSFCRWPFHSGDGLFCCAEGICLSLDQILFLWRNWARRQNTTTRPCCGAGKVQLLSIF